MTACYYLAIKDKVQLKKHYMSFIKNGAIFIPTKDELNLNNLISLKLKIPEDTKSFLVKGPVIWINPAYAQNGRTQGVGISFQNKKANILKEKIEQLLLDLDFNSTCTETL